MTIFADGVNVNFGLLFALYIVGYIFSFIVLVWNYEPGYLQSTGWGDYCYCALQAVYWPLAAPFIILGTTVEIVKHLIEENRR